jgi:hypothetical protein
LSDRILLLIPTELMAYPLRKDPENCLGKVHEDMHWIRYEVTTWAFYLKRLPPSIALPRIFKFACELIF